MTGALAQHPDVMVVVGTVLAFCTASVVICLILDRLYPPPPRLQGPPRAVSPQAGRGFEVVGSTCEVVGVDGLPLSVFRVVGVERTTQRDVDLLISAATVANAHVKAELRGIVVTAVVEVDAVGQPVEAPVVRVARTRV